MVSPPASSAPISVMRDPSSAPPGPSPAGAKRPHGSILGRSTELSDGIFKLVAAPVGIATSSQRRFSPHGRLPYRNHSISLYGAAPPFTIKNRRYLSRPTVDQCSPAPFPLCPPNRRVWRLGVGFGCRLCQQAHGALPRGRRRACPPSQIQLIFQPTVQFRLFSSLDIIVESSHGGRPRTVGLVPACVTVTPPWQPRTRTRMECSST